MSGSTPRVDDPEKKTSPASLNSFKTKSPAHTSHGLGRDTGGFMTPQLEDVAIWNDKGRHIVIGIL